MKILLDITPNLTVIEDDQDNTFDEIVRELTTTIEVGGIGVVTSATLLDNGESS